MTSLNTDWRRSAGDFECQVCKRKRLPASEFSKTQATLALRQSKTSGDLKAKCKLCVAAADIKTAAATTTATTATTTAAADGSTDIFNCSLCQINLPASAFTNSQKLKINRGKKGKCRDCVVQSEGDEVARLQAKKQQEQMDLEKRAKKNGVAGRLALACAETAAEASVVTGLKVKKGRGGGGRWRGRGGRRGRGRGRGK